MFKREYATALTAISFFVIAITGLMMYFHFFDKFVKEMHEIIGLFFILAVGSHVFFHWKSMKNYFSKKFFIIFSLLMTIAVVSFVVFADDEPSPKAQIVQAVLKAPIEQSLPILTGKDFNTAKKEFEVRGIKIGESKTLDEIAKNNKTSPFEIIEKLKE